MQDKTKSSVKCARDAMAYPPDCFSLPTDGRKAKHVCEKRRAVFIQFALYADGNGTRAWPGNKKIASECGVSERTAKRLIADLKELGCVSEAVGPDGKLKLHGPRGTTERLVTPKALPLPGSTAWHTMPGAPECMRFRNEIWDDPVGPDSIDASGAVGPNSTPVGPNSTPVGPDSIAVGPKPADFGPQPPPDRHDTATTTATNPSTSGGAGAGFVKDAGMAMVRYLAKQLQYVHLPATKVQTAALDKIAIGVPGNIMALAIQMWVRERPKGFHGLKDPVGRMADELPDYINAAVAAANAPPPGEYIFTPEEIAAHELSDAQANGFSTVAEYKAWVADIAKRCDQDTLGEEIMRELGLPEQGQEP